MEVTRHRRICTSRSEITGHFQPQGLRRVAEPCEAGFRGSGSRGLRRTEEAQDLIEESRALCGVEEELGVG
jgi:hypothetical protein